MSLGRQRSRLSRVCAGAGDRSSRALGALRGCRRGQEDGVATGFSNDWRRRQLSRLRGRHDRPPKADQNLLPGLGLGFGSTGSQRDGKLKAVVRPRCWGLKRNIQGSKEHRPSLRTMLTGRSYLAFLSAKYLVRHYKQNLRAVGGLDGGGILGKISLMDTGVSSLHRGHVVAVSDTRVYLAAEED